MSSKDRGKPAVSSGGGKKSTDRTAAKNAQTLASNKASVSSKHPSGKGKKPLKHNDKSKMKTDEISRVRVNLFKEKSRNADSATASIQEMATTSMPKEDEFSETIVGDRLLEQETKLDSPHLTVLSSQETDDDESTTLLDSQGTTSSSDRSNRTGPNLRSCTSADLSPSKTKLNSRVTPSEKSLPLGWERHLDKSGPYYWHVATGVIQRHPPTTEMVDESLVVYHDDEEINQGSTVQRTSSEEDDFMESGAALTLADEVSNIQGETMEFIVNCLGRCEFDETQLVSANNTRAIQKCILKLSNNPSREETMCWGLDQSQPILMRLHENYIQFLDVKTQSLYKSQPINTIKTWAVDDDNNFAFVVEERANISSINNSHDADYYESIEYELLAGPTFVCYVFSSMDDDDMSCQVAAKLNEEINKYKEQMTNRISKSTRLQQMVASKDQNEESRMLESNECAVDDDDDLDELVDSNETTMNVRYIGKVQVPRPIGIDILNIAIDKCLAEASKAEMNKLLGADESARELETITVDDDQTKSALTEATLHVSPSSVIVENTSTGQIIVECRIRYLTFMGISMRDIRWCGFIMQNVTTKTFEAHCFECYPTAGHVCDAIQASCSRMYEKMLKSHRQQATDTTSIIPKSSKIRDTLAKTLSRIKLTPLIQ